MTVRFDRPIATADRAQNLLDTRDTLIAVAQQLDDTTPTGVAAGMVRWSTTNNKWQKYSGSAWGDLATTYSINVTSLGGQAAANYLLKSGGTLTGFLTLHAAPTSSLHAATKAYADTKLPLAGGTMTGALTLSGAPTANLHAATKAYVDSAGLAVGFNAYRSTNQTSGSIFQCNAERFDEGGHYDSTTNYRFTAPVDGLYLFAASLNVNNSGGSTTSYILGLTKDLGVTNEAILAVHTEPGKVSNGSVTAIVKMVAGEFMYARCASLSATLQGINLQFSGSLVAKL